MNWLLLTVLYTAAAVAVSIFILRAALSVQQFLRYQKVQIKHLAEIALKQGVDAQKIDEIKKEANM